MLGANLVRLIEKHAEQLAKGLDDKLRLCDRTSEFKRVPAEELRNGALELYRHLGDWLLTKTESDIELRYKLIGSRRARQGVPISQFVWAIFMSKEHLWGFLQRESVADRAFELYGELQMLQLLDQFFDRAAYYAIEGYEQTRHEKAA